jgi:hypothetical protein
VAYVKLSLPLNGTLILLGIQAEISLQLSALQELPTLPSMKATLVSQVITISCQPFCTALFPTASFGAETAGLSTQNVQLHHVLFLGYYCLLILHTQLPPSSSLLSKTHFFPFQNPTASCSYTHTFLSLFLQTFTEQTCRHCILSPWRRITPSEPN